MFSSAEDFPSLEPIIEKAFSQNENFVSVINDPRDALWVRLHLIREAQRTIDIQTYAFSLDNSGSLLTQALVDATNRGVRVRVIIDQVGAEIDRHAMAGLVTFAPQMEIKVFRPIGHALKPSFISIAIAGMTHFVRINKRMHNKLMTVDGVLGIVGGRNLTDNYYGTSPEFTYQGREALLIGPLVQEMETTFRAYWENPLSVQASELRDVARVLRRKSYSVDDLFKNKPMLSHLQTLLNTPTTIEATMRKLLSSVYSLKSVDYVADVPGKREGWQSATSAGIQDLLLRAKSEIVIQTPYMVFDKRIRDLFKKIKDKNPGIQIQISTGSLVSTNSELLTYAAKLKQRKFTTNTLGVKVFELRPHPGEYPEMYVDSTKNDADEGHYFTVHAKAMVIDSQAVSIGSFNLDPRCFDLDTQSEIIAWDKDFASQVRAEILFDMTGPNSNKIDHRDHSQTITTFSYDLENDSYEDVGRIPEECKKHLSPGKKIKFFIYKIVAPLLVPLT
jgi:phosphatidylserine/phosphatidylglycerophosphate/cardiolipin synthase-like enzyme